MKILKTRKFQSELRAIRETLTRSQHIYLFKRISSILSDAEEDEDTIDGNVSQSVASTPCLSDVGPEADEREISFGDAIECVDAWSVPVPADAKSLKLLRDSLQADCPLEDIDHALDYFQVCVHDIPAEFFLQPPYIFLVSQVSFLEFPKEYYIHPFFSFHQSLQNLVQNRQIEESKFNLLTCLFELTKSVCKRVTARRLTKTYCYVDQVSR